MAARILDGKSVAREIRERLAGEVRDLAAGGISPGLAVILAGDDPASAAYVRGKERAAAEVGIELTVHRLPGRASRSQILERVNALNQDPAVHGFIVQMPLPHEIDAEEILSAVDPAKDVDGLHPLNLGRLLTGRPGLVPCTPRGIMELLSRTGLDLRGKRAVVVGRSHIVGRPVAVLLLGVDATVTWCHSRTANLAAETREADVLVAAAGKPGLVTGAMIKPGAVVIDVGINRVEGRLVGDVVFEEALRAAGWLTPVPGGVGPMTVAMLLQNTLGAAKALSGGLGGEVSARAGEALR